MSPLKKEIKIFCEKSKLIGNGHFVRSQRLFNFLNLKKKYKASIYCNKSINQINKIITNSNFFFYLVLDFKNYNKVYIKNKSNILKIIVIENLQKRKFHNSINMFPLDLQFKKNSGPSYYQYPKDIYLSKYVLNFNKLKKKINILIIQGGTDANNNLNKILRIFLNNNLSFNYKLIVKTNDTKCIKIDKNLKKKIKIIGKVKNISKVYENTDIAISSCGGTAFELGYFGIPTIHLTSEPREIERAKLLQKKKLGIFCPPINKKLLIKEINKIYLNNPYRKKLIFRRIKFFRKKSKILELFK